MKNLFTTTILLILSMTLLTTCVTAQSTTGSASAATAPAPTTAAQLATALNAMNEGAARVSGSTVTLTRNVGAERNLTVPEGVTLDIVGDEALLGIGDGRTLTVNGTVNASSNRIVFVGNPSARSITVNGSGTINLTGKGQLFGVWSGDGIKRKLTLDGVTLVGIADNDSSLVNVGEGAEFVMKSGAITGNTRTSDDWASGGGVQVHKGTFTLEGGEISGNSGGQLSVDVRRGAVFALEGGSVSDRTITWTLA